MKNELSIKRWEGEQRPQEVDILRLFEREGLQPYRWSNGPGDIYPAHSHSFHKVIYVVQGSIKFGLPDSGQTFVLNAGDRLDLPPGTAHNAVVGPDGVVCMEAHRDEYRS